MRIFSSLKIMKKEEQGLVWGGQQRNSDLQGPMLALSSHHCHPGERCTGPGEPSRRGGGDWRGGLQMHGIETGRLRGAAHGGKNMEVPHPAL